MFSRLRAFPRVREGTLSFSETMHGPKIMSEVRGIPPLYNLLKGIISAMQGMAWSLESSRVRVLD